MNINGYTRVCGLIGNPVEHTMSPAIHNTIAQSMGENLVYVPFHVPKGYVKEAVEGALALNLLGCNVTIPYKSDVIPYMKEMDGLAEKIGAVNTLVRVEGGFKGYNTDMLGLYRAMCEDDITVKGEQVIILGAGGVARAVALMLSMKGAEKIIILNRTLEKAQQIADEVNKVGKSSIALATKLDEYKLIFSDTKDNHSEKKKWLCIQATNVGMFPKQDEVVIEDPWFYANIHTGYDLIYNPSCTKFMTLAQKEGARAYNGLKMLLWQGIIAYELWTGKQVGTDLAQKAFEAMKEAMK